MVAFAAWWYVCEIDGWIDSFYFIYISTLLLGSIIGLENRFV